MSVQFCSRRHDSKVFPYDLTIVGALLALCLAGCSAVPKSFSPPEPISPRDVSHRTFDELLRAHVRDGRVNDRDIQSGERLTTYLKQVAAFPSADAVLPAGSIERLNAREADPAVQAAGFLHRFSGDDWRLKLISRLDNFRCSRSRIIYGDQALFVRRPLFDRLGGFPDRPMLEDMAFCELLLAYTRPILLSPPVVTDSRKFVKMGVWRSFARVLLIILHAQFRLPTLPCAFFQDIR